VGVGLLEESRQDDSKKAGTLMLNKTISEFFFMKVLLHYKIYNRCLILF
jgi:hypothetical protein